MGALGTAYHNNRLAATSYYFTTGVSKALNVHPVSSQLWSGVFVTRFLVRKVTFDWTQIVPMCRPPGWLSSDTSVQVYSPWQDTEPTLCVSIRHAGCLLLSVDHHAGQFNSTVSYRGVILCVHRKNV